MTMQLTIENELESYEVLKALIERKEKLHNDEEREYMDNLIDQFEGYNAYSVLVEE